MRNDYTHITAVLDRSGSMGTCIADTIGGFNTFLKKQVEAPGFATMTVVLFDHDYDAVCHGRPVAEVPPLTESTYIPRGSTALLDAMGRAITYTGALLESKPEAERPAKVVMLIITDGHENASHDYTRARIAEMVKHQTDVYRWDFVYLGATADAITVAGTYGINVMRAARYDTSGVEAFSAFQILGDKVGGLRGQSMAFGSEASFTAFSADERKKMSKARHEPTVHDGDTSPGRDR